MSVIYLRFNSPDEAYTTLINAGFTCTDEFASNFFKGNAFGSCFYIEDNADHYLCNIYDYDSEELDNMKIDPPTTPYNVRA